MFKRAIIIILIFVTLAIIHLFFYTKIIDIGFKIEKLSKELSEIRSQNRNLNSLVSKEESLDRIEKIAEEKLNMEYPKSNRFLKY